MYLRLTTNVLHSKNDFEPVVFLYFLRVYIYPKYMIFKATLKMERKGEREEGEGGGGRQTIT